MPPLDLRSQASEDRRRGEAQVLAGQLTHGSTGPGSRVRWNPSMPTSLKAARQFLTRLTTQGIPYAKALLRGFARRQARQLAAWIPRSS